MEIKPIVKIQTAIESAEKKTYRLLPKAIASYKEQISKLEGKENKSQSAEFKRLIAGLNAELDQRTQKLNEITKQLAEKNQQLAVNRGSR